MLILKNNQKGLAALFISILVLFIIFGIIISVATLIFSEQKILRNIIKSSQSYYAAEAGIEDALLRLKNNPGMSALSYNLNVADASANINISSIIGGSRVITSQGNVFSRIRKIQTVYAIDAQEISFYYGAQIGDGGMEMGNNARIKGNVFSNGSVVSLSGKGYIDNSIIVAHNGNRIEGLEVGEDALAHTCKNSTIVGDLTYVSGGSATNCPAGGFINSQPNEIEPKDLPISSEQINEWKQQAADGGVINNDVSLDSETSSLGPIQIGTVSSPKNLTVTNNSQLEVRGTIYVTGNINFNNNVVIELDEDSYGPFSGVIIADGGITVENNAILRGSGELGSYILILSTNNSLDPNNPAINVGNNALGAIFYTTSGLIFLSNNMEAREITGYKIRIENNAEIEYESGLQDSIFSSGPGASWQVKSWKETE